MSTRDVGIGTRVWEFDNNRRVYRKDEDGRSHGGPIFEEHFTAFWIVGKEGRSWILGWAPDDMSHPRKVSKASLAKKYYTDGERDAAIWTKEHRYALMRKVERCDDVGTLKEIARLVGYEA